MTEGIKSTGLNSSSSFVCNDSKRGTGSSKDSIWWTNKTNYRSTPLERNYKTLGGQSDNSTRMGIGWKYSYCEVFLGGRGV